jgi:hypothetical protein
VISVQLAAMLTQVTPEADRSAVAGLLMVLTVTLVGLWFIRLLVSGGRLVAIATVGLIRLVISRVFVLLLALALLVAVVTASVRLPDGPWPWDRQPHDPAIARQQQDRHLKGTPQYRQRRKLGKPTTTWDDPTEADPLTREAWRKGTAMRGRPRVRDWDAGRRIGADPEGRSLTHIRVSWDNQGRIYGWPAG